MTNTNHAGRLLKHGEYLLVGAVFFACGASACGVQLAAHGFVSSYGLVEALALSTAIVLVSLHAIRASRTAALPSREAEARLALLARAAGQLLADSQVQTGLKTNMNALRARLEAF